VLYKLIFAKLAESPYKRCNTVKLCGEKASIAREDELQPSQDKSGRPPCAGDGMGFSESTIKFSVSFETQQPQQQQQQLLQAFSGRSNQEHQG